jgi:hypothetical protein
MSETVKNIVVGIVFIGVAVAGYYMFLQRDSGGLTLDGVTPQNAELLARTEAFIARRSQLEALKLDVTFFQSPTFTSLRSYTTVVPDQGVGRENIFETPASVPTTRTIPVE